MENVADFVGGCVGGIASVAVGHPLDTIKVRMQQVNATTTGLFIGFPSQTWVSACTILRWATLKSGKCEGITIKPDPGVVQGLCPQATPSYLFLAPVRPTRG